MQMTRTVPTTTRLQKLLFITDRSDPSGIPSCRPTPGHLLVVFFPYQIILPAFSALWSLADLDTAIAEPVRCITHITGLALPY